jgi:outer membrane protein assembly factor BamB
MDRGGAEGDFGYWFVVLYNRGHALVNGGLCVGEERLNMRFVFTAVPIVAVLAATCGLAQDAIYQSNEARTGEVDKLDLGDRPQVIWRFVPERVNGAVPDLGGVLAAGGRVFTSDRKGRIYAFAASDGKLLWTRHVIEERCEAPLVMGDIAYFATGAQVIALSVFDGTTVWEFAIPDGANETSPLMIESLLLVCGYDGIVHAMDAQAGTEQWTRDVVSDAPLSPPGFDGQRARIGDKPARPKIAASDGKTLFQPIFDQSRVVALDCQTGDVRWSFRASGWIYAHPVVTDDAVFIGSQDRKFYRLEKDTGKVVWTFKAAARIEAGAAVHDGAVYFGSCEGKFYRLDAKTGEKRWSFECDRYANGKACPIYASPLVSDETVYLAGMEGQIYALAAADGTLRWKLRPTPDAEIEDWAADGARLFVTTRHNREGAGEQGLFVIGKR